jgi:hypothetical protein
MAGLEADDGGQLERLAGVRPVAAAAPAFGGAVVQQEAVPKPVLGAPERNVDEVLAGAERLARSESDVQVLHVVRRGVLPHQAGGGAVRPLPHHAQLPVELGVVGARVREADGGLDRPLQPVVVQTAGGLLGLGIVVQEF